MALKLPDFDNLLKFLHKSTMMVKNLIKQFDKQVWDIDVSKVSKSKSILIKLLRGAYLIGLDVTKGDLTMRAMSLVYTTLLSLAPLLAVTFSVLTAFGVQRGLADALYGLLQTPLGPENALKIKDWLVTFVENIKVGVMGSLGLIVLMYTVISLVQKIETSFNAVWKVKTPRSLMRRFSDYMSVILIGPVFIYAALGITASMKSTSFVQRIESIEVFGTLINIAFRLIPYVLVWCAFTFVYFLIPNTNVRGRSALFGGVIAGLLWQTAGWIFATFVVSSSQRSAIYSSFAILFFFIIWIYISWVIVLIGSKITFFHQHPQSLNARVENLVLSNRQKEEYTLSIMYLIAYNYYYDKQPWTIEALLKQLGIPPSPLIQVIAMLREKDYLVETGSEPPAYVPARDIDTISLKELLFSVRRAEEHCLILKGSEENLQNVKKLIEDIETTVANELDNMTLKGLVLESVERTA